MITQKVIVKDAKTLKVIEGASIAMFNSIWAVNGNTSVQGEALFPVYQDTILYKVVVGKWGYLHASIDFDSKQLSADIVVLLRNWILIQILVTNVMLQKIELEWL